MKAEFEILKARPAISVVLTRDSVAAGDDVDAPHARTVTVYSFVDPEAFARAISAGYLPSVAGVGHRWICLLNGLEIVEITNSGIRALVHENQFAQDNRAHFVYHPATF
jgi:hypothetical protein